MFANAFARINDYWPNARYLVLVLSFAWTDVLLFSPLLLSSHELSTGQGDTTLLSTLAMTLCAIVLAVFGRKADYGTRGFLAMAATSMCSAVLATAFLAMPDRPTAELLVWAGALLSGVASAGLFVCSACIFVRNDAASLLSVCVNAGVSRVLAGFVFFFIVGLPAQLAIATYLLIPLLWFCLVLLDRFACSFANTCTRVEGRVLNRAYAVPITRLSLLLALLFFVSSLPRAGSGVIEGSSNTFWGQMVMFLTMTLCAILAIALVLRRDKYRFLLTVSFYAAGCVLLVLFMSMPVGWAIPGFEMVAASVRNLVDIFSLMIFVSLVRDREFPPARSIALFHVFKFSGCLLGLFAGTAIGNHAIAFSAMTLVTLLLLVVSLLKRDVETAFMPATSSAGSHDEEQKDYAIARFSAAFALSQREEDVLELMKQGYSVKLISEKLSVSPNTVKTHIRNIYSKTGASCRDEIYRMIDEI